TLHPRHPAWDSALFMQSGLLERLTEHVVLLHDGDTLELRASGVPPHVSILKSLRTVLTEPYLNDLGRRLSSDVVNAVTTQLEHNAASAGHVTPAALKEALSECFDAAFSRSGLNALVQNGGGPGADAAPVATASAGQRGLTCFTWEDGTAHPVPSDWKLSTTVNLETMWDHWFLASPPLRLLQQANVPKSQRKRLHDLRWIMGQIERKVKTIEGAWKASPTSLAETREMFGMVIEEFPLRALVGGRKRRKEQLSWTTFVKEWRVAERERR
ncbi:unnamed protein product, partial [Phaeothamnion confervicola]